MSSTYSIEELIAMPVLERYEAFRAIENVAERRAVTAQVHKEIVVTWKQHPRWGGMAAHLVQDIHPYYRSGFERLMRACEAKREVDKTKFRHLNNSLHHHHSIEDHAWFPRLKEGHEEFIPEIRQLEADHRNLVVLEKRVMTGDFAALAEFYHGLIDHLNREEMITVPWLLDGTGALYF
ncbi:hypothetical protein SDRG_07347 [Saprolegnia diclina VS20]|uniref:Hemerythrin-like domain-containing protein n=1 Tax=Saprolegnia diclina (strain VS20) TaxID=1156394 RepID=T0QB51_SAPDV|nr:hypothetical protein SDRG_07347 [Saprolegnia diclina VS20]EQC35114.1 hypothetical protein SDRG_07347 [Saprolegnia diclina VS20]|eukprot:XP_008611398.1 hypothetical protein SDRG_07347 [Saprolegnia diclina VS20]